MAQFDDTWEAGLTSGGVEHVRDVDHHSRAAGDHPREEVPQHVADSRRTGLT